MRSNSLCLLAAFVFLSNAPMASSAEPIATPVPAAPATRSVAAMDARSVAALDARTLAIHQYFYVDFPRQLQTLENETQLVEAELALIVRRVESYRPFRSFGRYAATYTADQSWQIALLAAQQRLECLRNDQADLWRQRGFAAAALGAQTPR
jgi:hypothetical protein